MKHYICVLTLLFTSFLGIGQNISGIVNDENDEALFGVNVIIQNSNHGQSTNIKGEFNFDYKGGFPILLKFSYTGFEPQEVLVSEANVKLIVILEEGILFGKEIVVSASRKAEKLLEAPAAVKVLSNKELSASGGSINPIRALINAPGVELQQQTGQRINLALRGGNGVFSTEVFPMLDYRSLISPGLEFFDSQNSPINNIDLERIEVVLGPGSALYGPDVTTGVVHFISKDPFKYPGSTVELIYGEMNTFKTALRHGGHNKSKTFGYKINARYGSGNDFTLDPDHPDDQAILENFQETISRGFITEAGFLDPQLEGIPLLTTGKVQDPKYMTAAINIALHLKPFEETEVVASGGWNTGNSIFYNDLGEGLSQSNEVWTQLRVNHKGLFAQAYYIGNDGGDDAKPSYLNRTGLIVPLERSHLEGQIQYNFETPSFFEAEWSVGLDYRNATANTENHVYGRNENNDDYRIFGGYFQSKLKFGSKFDLFLAGRYDSYNFTDENTFSPRVALVYKSDQNNTFRLSYNRAANPIPASDIYFDLPLQTTPLFNVWNMGGIRPQTFDDPMITWLIPGVPKTSFQEGFPLAAAYGAVNLDVIAEIEALGSQDPSLAPLVPLLKQLLSSSAPEGYSGGIASTDLDGNELLPVNRETKLISQLSSYEFGYKGLFFGKLAAGLDVYYLRKKGASRFSQVSPIITMTSLAEDLGAGVQSTFQPQIEQALIDNGYDTQSAMDIAQEIGGLLNGAYLEAGSAFLEALSELGLPFHGLVESDQLPDSDFPHLAFGYPSFDPDEVNDDWGFEMHLKYFFTNEFSSFANYTWFNSPTGSPGEINFPRKKIRVGLNYGEETGINGSLAYQWDQAFTSSNSTFPGEVDARSLLDISVGYGFENGLKIETLATNALNNEFRSLPGFPRIGRRLTGRIVYDF